VFILDLIHYFLKFKISIKKIGIIIRNINTCNSWILAVQLRTTECGFSFHHYNEIMHLPQKDKLLDQGNQETNKTNKI